MKHKLMVAFMLILLLPPLSANAFAVVHTQAYPNQIYIEWSKAEGASYYDIYLDHVFTTRITRGFGATVGTNEEPLYSHHTYHVMVVGRADGNRQVGVAATEVTTAGWEGRYRWINETKKDNRGQVRQLDFRVSFSNGAYRIEGLYDRWHTIFPLVPSAQIGEQFSYNGRSAVEQAYRQNAQLFNTSLIRPDVWTVVDSWQLPSSMGVEIRTRAMATTVHTHSSYTFTLSESKTPYLHFKTSAHGIAAHSIFRSPNEGDEGIFKARQI